MELITTDSGVIDVVNYNEPRCEGRADVRSAVINEDATSIVSYAFADSKNLESVTIPSSVKTIDDHTFTNCTALESVVISGSIESIGIYSFCHCTLT